MNVIKRIAVAAALAAAVLSTGCATTGDVNGNGGYAVHSDDDLGAMSRGE